MHRGGRPDQAGHRCGVDDRARTALGQQLADLVLHGKEHTAQVDGEGAVEQVLIGIGIGIGSGGAFQFDTRVVEGGVQPA